VDFFLFPQVLLGGFLDREGSHPKEFPRMIPTLPRLTPFSTPNAFFHGLLRNLPFLILKHFPSPTSKSGPLSFRLFSRLDFPRDEKSVPQTGNPSPDLSLAGGRASLPPGPPFSCLVYEFYPSPKDLVVRSPPYWHGDWSLLPRGDFLVPFCTTPFVVWISFPLVLKDCPSPTRKVPYGCREVRFVRKKLFPSVNAVFQHSTTTYEHAPFFSQRLSSDLLLATRFFTFFNFSPLLSGPWRPHKHYFP